MKKKISLKDFEHYLNKTRKKSGDHLLSITIETYLRLTTDLFENKTLQLPFKQLVTHMNKEIKKYQNPVLMSAYRRTLKYLGHDEADCKKLKVEFNLAVASRSKRFLQSKVLSKKEILQLIDGMNTIQDKLTIALLYDTGCRREELLKIRMKHINFRKKEIKIMGKGEIQREVYYMPSTQRLMLNHVKEQQLKKESDEKLIMFYNRQGAPVKHQDNALYKWFVEKSALVLGRHAHPHMFRHTCFTHMADDGADILDIKAYAGHSDIKTSMIYVEVSAFRRKNAFKKYKKDLVDIRKEEDL